MTGGTPSSKIMECSIKAARENQLCPIKTQSYMWLWVFSKLFWKVLKFWKAFLGPNTSQCFPCTGIVSCLTFAFVTKGKDMPLHTPGISLQNEVLSHKGTVLFKHKAQMYHHCTGCHPCCPSLLLRRSCDSSATLGAGGITSTSFHFLALPYLHSSSSDHFHGQFCLLCTARNVSLSLKVLHCLWGVRLCLNASDLALKREILSGSSWSTTVLPASSWLSTSTSRLQRWVTYPHSKNAFW